MAEVINHSGAIQGVVTNTDVTESTSNTTGSLVLAGGMGMAKNLYLGGEFHYQNIKLPNSAHLLNSLSTGLHNGGTMSINGTTQIDIAAGNGVIVNSHDNPDIPTETDIEWSAIIGTTISNLANTFTHIYITNVGTVLQSLVEPTATFRRNNIYLGKVIHSTGTVVEVTSNQPEVGINTNAQFHDLITGLGPIIFTGNRISANGSNLSLDKSSGDMHQSGIDFASNKASPNIKNIPLNTLASLGLSSRNGFIATSSVLIPGNYDNAGTVEAIPGSSNRSTNQRVYLFNSGSIGLQYGQQWYASLALAKAGISTEPFVISEISRTNAVLIAIISVTKGATDLSLESEAGIFSASKFGEVSIGASGAQTTDLQHAYDNSVTPEITVDSTRGGLTVIDNSTPIAANLFEVQTNTTTNIFSVDTGGIDLNGNITLNTTADQSITKAGSGNLNIISPTTMLINAAVLNVGTNSDTTDINIGTNTNLSGAINLGLTTSSATTSLRSGTGRFLIDSRAQTLIQGNTVDLNSLTGSVSVLTTTESSSTTTGGFKTLGGAGIAGNIHCGGDVHATSLIGNAGILSINSSTHVNIEGAIFNSASLTAVNALTQSGGYSNTNTTNSTSTTSTASMKTSGGLSVAKDIHCDNIFATNLSAAPTTGTVTQLTDNLTAVTLNAEAGVISMAAGSINAHTREDFTFTNSFISTTSIIMCSTGGTSILATSLSAHPLALASGSCTMSIYNSSGSANPWTNTCKIHFHILNV